MAKRGGGGRRSGSQRGNRAAWVLLAALPALVLSFCYQYFWAGSGDGAAADAASPLRGKIVLSEIMSSNQSALRDERGKYPDWIELYNASGESCNLKNLTLLDGEGHLVGFRFPDMILAPGARQLVFASGRQQEVAGYELHAPFKLSAQGDSVYLRDENGLLIDSVTLPALSANESYARGADGGWSVTMRATPGLDNSEESFRALSEAGDGVRAGSLLISEIMPGNESYFAASDGKYYDYIEIHNASGAAANLSGFGLSDKEGKPGRYLFPNVTIPADGYLLIYASGYDKYENGELHAPFRLSADGEAVLLSDPEGRILDLVRYPAGMGKDRSYSRIGGERFSDSYPPTPFAANDAAGLSYVDKVQRGRNAAGLILNEAVASARKQNANKAASDWIELYNGSNAQLDLAGFGLSDDPGAPRKWRFPAGASIAPGEYLLIYASGLDKSDVSKKAYHTNFKLSYARGETITLAAADGTVIDRLPLFNQSPAVSFGRPAGAFGLCYFETPTPGAANDGARADELLPKVSFSRKGGWLDAPVTVSLSCASAGATIRYTLDCTEPNESSPVYEAPFQIAQNTVLRARAYKQGAVSGLTATESFLFGQRHTLPVVSVVTDPSYLYDDKIGIASMGENKNLKYPYKGANFWRDLERAANVEYFSLSGETVLSQGAGIALQGQYSRMEKQKAFKLTARNAYGENSFAASLFPNRPYTSYKSFILRSSGQDENKTRMRDSILTSLAEGTDIKYQDTQPVIVYLNGEYWGHYNMRERVHKYSIAQWENWEDEDAISIVKANDDLKQGSNKDFKALLKWVKKNGCKTQENLDYVNSIVDVDNYLDYVAIEMYIGNTDLLNVKRYRSDEGDGRWKWILYDTDWAFYTDTDSYRRWLDPAGAGSGKKTDNTLFVQLMKNPAVKEKFLTRMGELMYNNFRSELVLAKIDARYQLLESEMPAQLAKWGGSMSTWKSRVKAFRNYAAARPKKMLGYIRKEEKMTNDELRKYFGDIMNELGL